MPGSCILPATTTIGNTNSTCSSCTLTGGALTIAACDAASTIVFYSSLAGSAAIPQPAYNPVAPITVFYACVNTTTGCRSAIQSYTTTIGACATPTPPTGTLSLIESVCTGACTATSGSISVGSKACSTGVLEYSLDNSAFTSSLPAYNNSNTITVYSRCSCSSTSTSTSVSISTNPAPCAAPAAALVGNISSTCSGCTVSGGGFTLPTPCIGSTLTYYSSASGTTVVASPNYDPFNAITIYYACVNAVGCRSAISTYTTTVANCSTPIPAVVSNNNSICSGCTLLGGNFIVSTPCDANSSLIYYNDATGIVVVPTPLYDQSNSVTIFYACVNNITGCSSAIQTYTSTVGSCPLPSSPTGAPVIVQSACSAACVSTLGSINTGTLTCTTGSLEYSINGGISWTSTVPAYNNTTALTMLVRCYCNSTSASVSVSFATTPATCPSISTPAIGNTSSTCSGCVASGGGFVTLTPCTGSTLKYYSDATASIEIAPPIYNPSTSSIVYYACVNTLTGCSSAIQTYTTTVGVCPAISTPSGGLIINNSTCNAGCSQTLGTITQGALACAVGSLQYSTNGGATWSFSIPVYDPITALNISTRCACTTTASFSSALSFATAPVSCTVPAAPSGAIVDNVCPSTVGSIACDCGLNTTQYSTNGGTTWSSTPPVYSLSSINFLARCVNATGCTSSSPAFSTSPTVCLVCPILTTVAPAVIIQNESACDVGCSTTSGLIVPPSTTCPIGSALQYSLDNITWSATLPTYNNSIAITIRTRCLCDIDAGVVSPSSVVSTVPSGCSIPSAPTSAILNNNCPSTTGTIACDCGPNTVQYSSDGGGTWSNLEPSYSTTIVNFLSRCVNAFGCTSSSLSFATAPVVCPSCPAFTSAIPVVIIAQNANCGPDCAITFGSIIAPTTSCPLGSVLHYSTDNIAWSSTLPIYDNVLPMTVSTRCSCSADASVVSSVVSVTTTPTVCVIPSAPVSAIIDNVCPSLSGEISCNCLAGNTTEYSTDGGLTWSDAAPNYTSVATTFLSRCINAQGCTSLAASFATAPNSCLIINITDPCSCNAANALTAIIQVNGGTAPFVVTAIAAINPTSGLAYTLAEANVFLNSTTGVLVLPLRANDTYSVSINDASTNSVSTASTFICDYTAITFGLIDTTFCNTDANVALSNGSPIGGNYFIDAALNATIQPSLLSAGAHTASYILVDANACSQTENVSFVIENCFGLSGQIWADTVVDNNVYDATEVLVEGVIITVIDPATGEIVATTLSNASGEWSVANLPNGSYQVVTSGSALLDLIGATVLVSIIDNSIVTNFPLITTDALSIVFEAFYIVGECDKSVLNWKVSNTEGLLYFEILRSVDGINFTSISQIATNPTNINQQKFTFIDNYNSFANTYYKIKMLYSDGSTKYSVIRTVSSDCSIDVLDIIEIMPNPALGDLNFLINANTEGDIIIKTFDVTGREVSEYVSSIVVGLQTVTMPVDRLATGVYYSTVLYNNKQVTTTKFIKK